MAAGMFLHYLWYIHSFESFLSLGLEALLDFLDDTDVSEHYEKVDSIQSDSVQYVPIIIITSSAHTAAISLD